MDDYADKKTVWVKGYTKPDGTKVKGHYRDVGSGTQGLTRKGVARAINRFRLGVSDKIDVRPKNGQHRYTKRQPQACITSKPQ